MGKIIKIGNDSKSKGFLFKKKRLFIWFGVVILLFVIILFFTIYNSNQTSQNLDSKVVKMEELQKAYVEADRLAFSGNYEQGQKALDDLLNSATNDIDRSSVYIQKSTLAINNSYTDDAINFAIKADGLSPSRQSASILAGLYESYGDTALSLKYYKLVIERTTDQEKNTLLYDYEYYQSKVKELSER